MFTMHTSTDFCIIKIWMLRVIIQFYFFHIACLDVGQVEITVIVSSTKICDVPQSQDVKTNDISL
jgi:hypothetical protein